ncbi:MAG: (Fe-S)-binding protein [Caldilineales bacterium]|nr:(Fe-S)-binding protein [Caldilineales bacterium]
MTVRSNARHSLALHSPCWAQAFRPGVVAAMHGLATRLGLDVTLPRGQTCCGLPAWDAGEMEAARAAARRSLRLFQPFMKVLTPSAGCLRMFHHHFPDLFAGQPEAAAALDLARRSQSWAAFLDAEIGAEALGLRFSGRIAYFQPCTQADAGPVQRLLAGVRGASLVSAATPVCCGFGANLSWRQPDLARVLGEQTVAALRLSGADLCVTDDAGCLSYLAPLMAKLQGPPLYHLAEFLAAA